MDTAEKASTETGRASKTAWDKSFGALGSVFMPGQAETTVADETAAEEVQAVDETETVDKPVSSGRIKRRIRKKRVPIAETELELDKVDEEPETDKKADELNEVDE